MNKKKKKRFGTWANEIKGLVFKDTDRNGAFTAGERWYNGELVDLISNSTGAILDTVTTTNRGLFSFLTSPGLYNVCVRSSPGLVLVSWNLQLHLLQDCARV